MSRIVTATASVSVSAPGAGQQGRVMLELEGGVSFTGDLFVKCYPSQANPVRATVGTLTPYGTREEARRMESVVFQDSDTAQTRYPVGGGGVEVTQVGMLFGPNGEDASGVRFTLDAEADVIRASRRVSGAILVSYTARYARYLYRPQVVRRREVRFGTVMAWHKGAMATLEVDLEQSQRETTRAELYNVYSLVIARGDSPELIEDVWEMPPGWPESNTYPAIAVPNPPEPDTAVSLRRVHETGWIDGRGRFQLERNFITREQPYTFTRNYTPVYRYKQGSAPEELEEQFLDFDWSALQQALASRYPGIQGLGG